MRSDQLKEKKKKKKSIRTEEARSIANSQGCLPPPTHFIPKKLMKNEELSVFIL
jgi:hypothetical protein